MYTYLTQNRFVSITFKIYGVIKPDFFANTISRVAIQSKGNVPFLLFAVLTPKAYPPTYGTYGQYKHKAADENRVTFYYFDD